MTKDERTCLVLWLACIGIGAGLALWGVLKAFRFIRGVIL